MKRNLALASGIAILIAMFSVPSHATVTANGGGYNGSKINGSKVNGENLNGENLNGGQSGQALRGLALNQVTVSLPR